MGSFASMIGLFVSGLLFETIETYVFIMGSLVFFLVTALMIILRFKHPKKSKNKTEDPLCVC